VGYCSTASPDDIEVQLKQLTDGTMRMTCINHLEAVIDKVPDAMRYLSDATGPTAPFEKPPRRVLDAVPPGRSDSPLQVEARIPRRTTERSRLDLARLTAGRPHARCPGMV
jgi:hypothetical protein